MAADARQLCHTGHLWKQPKHERPHRKAAPTTSGPQNKRPHRRAGHTSRLHPGSFLMRFFHSSSLYRAMCGCRVRGRITWQDSEDSESVRRGMASRVCACVRMCSCQVRNQSTPRVC